MASGFSFLRTQFPGLEKTGEFAERITYNKLRKFNSKR